MPEEKLIADGYDEFLRDLKERIRSAQIKAALAVNRELTLLCFAGPKIRLWWNMRCATLPNR